MGKDRLFSPVFILIIACTLCCFLFGQGANAGTTVYLEVKGESTSLAGIGALVFSIFAALARVITGPLSDARGRKIAIVVGSLIMVAGGVGPIFSNVGIFFIIWRTLQGLGFATATTALATAAADVLPFSRLGEGIGYYGLGQAISMSCGPAIAIALVYSDSPENFYIGLTVFAIIALVVSFFISYERDPESLPATSEFLTRWKRGDIPYAKPPENTDSENEGTETNSTSPNDSQHTAEDKPSKTQKLTLRGLADGIFEPPALRGTIPMMFISTSFGFGIFFMGVYGAHLGVGNPGLFYTISAVTMIIVRLTSGKFMDRYRPIFIMGAAVASGLITYSMLLGCDFIGGNGLLFYIAGAFYGVSLGISLPINQAIAVKLSSPERWGAANGLYLFGNDIGIGFSSMIWGMTVPALGYPITLMCVMGCITISFIAALICYPKERV